MSATPPSTPAPSALPGYDPEPSLRDGSGSWLIRPDRRVVIAALLAGLGLDLLVSHPFGASSAMALVVIMAAVAAPAGRHHPIVAGLLAMAAVFAVLLVVRATPWLTWLNLLAAFMLTTIAIAARPDDAGIGPAHGRVVRVTPVLASAARAPALLFTVAVNEISVVSVNRRAVGSWTRAMAMTAPAVAVLVVLLASADAVFASFLVVPADPIGLGRHGFVIAGGSVVALGAIALMISDRSTEPPRTRRLGSIEAGSILAAFAVVEAGFVASQVAAIVGGADYVRSSTGLTYAEYARSGFFQLLAAAALALAVLWIVDHLTRQLAPSSRRRIARFGLAVVFVVAAVHLVRRRGSLLMSIAVSAFIGLLAMNAANPEAVVARRNLHRFGGTEQLDVAYLVNNLGPDAADVLYDHPTTRAVLCSRPAPDADPWLTLNVGRRRAAAAHTRTCP